jgi:hypothetical protein
MHSLEMQILFTETDSNRICLVSCIFSLAMQSNHENSLYKLIILPKIIKHYIHYTHAL